MAITAAKLLVEVNANTKQATSELEKVEKQVKRLESIGDGLTDVGKKMTVGVTLPIIAAGVASVAMASNMDESLNKVNVVFGQSADEIEAWSKGAASAMGMSQQQALEATGTLGNLFTAMGLGVDQSSEMSMSLVQLASDLASFNNIDPTVALEKLRAGLVGEVEPLRTLGVNLSAAAVEAKALEMGLAATTEEITPAILAQARYALILEQTQSAQGDFARTSDGLANSTRSLKADMADLSGELGEALIPFAKEAVTKARELLGAFGDLSPETQGLILKLAGIAAVGGPALIGIGNLVKGLAALKSAASLAGISLAAVGGPITLIVGGLAALGAAIGIAIQDWQAYKTAMAGTGNTSQQTMDTLAALSGNMSMHSGQIHDVAGAWEAVEARAAAAELELEKLNSEALAETARQAELAAEAQRKFSEALNAGAEAALQAGLAGTLSEAMDRYNASLGENATAQEAARAAMAEATREMIYQQAAAGLDASASLELARAMGMIAEEDYAVAATVQNLKLQYDAMDGALDGVIANSSGFVNATVNVNEAVAALQEQNLPLTIENIATSMANLQQEPIQLAIEADTTALAGIDPESPEFEVMRGKISDSITLAFEGAATAVQEPLSQITISAQATIDETNAAFTNATFSKTGQKAGQDIVTGFKSGIGGSGGEEGESGLLGISAQLIADMKKLWTVTTNWTGVGEKIIQGIAAGVDSATGILEQAIEAAVAAALEAAMNAAGIQSPSKVFAREVGVPITAGIAAGIIQAAPLPAQAMQSVITNTSETVYQQPVTVYADVNREIDYYELANVVAGMLRG